MYSYMSLQLTRFGETLLARLTFVWCWFSLGHRGAQMGLEVLTEVTLTLECLVAYLEINKEKVNMAWWCINCLAPGRCDCNFKSIIFKLILQNSSLGTQREIFSGEWHRTSLMRSQHWFMLQIKVFLWNCPQVNATEHIWWCQKLVQVMALCRQKTSH